MEPEAETLIHDTLRKNHIDHEEYPAASMVEEGCVHMLGDLFNAPDPAEVNRGVLPRSDRSVGWRIASVNLVGSVAFGASAVAARYLTTTGEVANISLVNAGTFLGAIGFFVGAALLPVESAEQPST